ncbi:MAG: hypothetical protein HY748_06585 [Elusimicrobia bacterium]|nr:hypothetical protein [Elusimicrobiota bacterium]
MANRMMLAVILLAVSSAGRAAPAAPAAQAIDEKYLLQTQGECRQGTGDYLRYLGRLTLQPKDYTLRILVPNPNNPADLSWKVAGEHAAACLDSAGDPKAPCQPLGSVDAEAVGNCRELGAFASFATALYRQGDAAVGPFRRFLPLAVAGKDFAKSETDRLLPIFAKAYKTGDVLPLCAEGLKGKWPEMEAPDDGCPEISRVLSGDPRRCADLRDGVDRASCIARASLMQALRSPDPKACSASPLCDAANRRDPKACAPLLKKANESFCVRVGSLAAPFMEKENARKAEETRGMAKGEEKRRREAQILADVEKKRREEEKILKEKATATDYKLWQEVAAKKRAEDDRVLKALQERKQKKQFQGGQRMEITPLDVLQAIDKVNKGKQ